MFYTDAVDNGEMNPRPSVADRLRQWWDDFPLLSRTLFVVCVGVYILQLTTLIEGIDGCLSPYLVVDEYQVYRILSSPFLHGSVLHILFNMLMLVSIAPMLERACGTAALLMLTLFFIFTAGILDIVICGLFQLTKVSFLMKLFSFTACALGFSGVLFSYLTLEVHVYNTVSSRTLFGLCTVPAAVYPWVMLLLLQLLWPGASFSGHLCGILAGYLGCLLPRSTLESFDRCIPAAVKRVSCYRLSPAGFVISGVLSTGQPSGASASLASMLPARLLAATSGSTEAPRFPGQGRTLGSGRPAAGNTTAGVV
eukprot:RCo016615